MAQKDNYGNCKISQMVRFDSDLGDLKALHFCKLAFADAISVEDEALGLEGGGAVEALQQVLNHSLQILQNHKLLRQSDLPTCFLDFICHAFSCRVICFLRGYLIAAKGTCCKAKKEENYLDHLLAVALDLDAAAVAGCIAVQRPYHSRNTWL